VFGPPERKQQTVKPARETFIAGVSITPFIGKGHPDFVWKKHPDFGKRENPDLEEYLSLAINGLFSQGLDPTHVTRGYVGNFAGELFNQQGHLGALVSRVQPELAGVGIGRSEAACASGGVAIVSAAEAVCAGHDVVLVAGAECQTTVKARLGGEYLARAAHFKEERAIDDFTFPALFARRIKAYHEKYGLDISELGHFTMKAMENARKNPLAHMKANKWDLASASSAGDHNPCFLGNEELKDYLRMSDCSQVTDGGAALLLCSEEGLEKLGVSKDKAVRLRSYHLATNPLGQTADPTRMDTAAKAFCKTFTDGDVKLTDIGVAEVHDCFTIAELLMMEAMGLEEPGKGINAVKSGKTALSGSLPVNTGGGLVGFGHPVGATGVKQAAEIYRQMKGQCGDYQLATRPDLGLMANMGGDDRTCFTALFENLE
jgi:acetyl-CoA C-acetyltransferase